MVVPQYRLLRETLATAILDGGFADGRLPTEQALCAQYGLSRATVGRALADLVREGLIERRPRAGTFVRNTHRGPVIGLLAPGLGDTEFLAPLEAALRTVVSGRRGRLIQGSVDPLEDSIDRLLAPLLAAPVDGILCAPLHRPRESPGINRALIAATRRAGVPMVLIDRDSEVLPARSELDVVACDHLHSGFLLGAHLAALGHQRIIFASPSGLVGSSVLREAGVQAALRSSAAVLEGLMIADEPDAETVQRLLAEQPDAIVCVNDLMAARLMPALFAAGCRIPEDCAMAGFDDVTYASVSRVPLTTVRQPHAAIADAAVATLLQRIAEPALPPRQILLTGELIARASTASGPAT